MPKKKSAARPSGGAQLKASGKSPVLIGLTPENREIISQAAALECRPVTQFFLYHTLTAAKKVVEKAKNIA